jgi:hypothetical protein
LLKILVHLLKILVHLLKILVHLLKILIQNEDILRYRFKQPTHKPLVENEGQDIFHPRMNQGGMHRLPLQGNVMSCFLGLSLITKHESLFILHSSLSSGRCGAEPRRGGSGRPPTAG